jgi:hypothetical protein
VAAYYRAERDIHWWSPEGTFNFWKGAEYDLTYLLPKYPDLWSKIKEGGLVPIPAEPAPPVGSPSRLARILTLDLV